MDTFNDAHLIGLVQMPKAKIIEVLNGYSVRENLYFHRRLTESIVGFSKRNKKLVTTQWELVCIAEMVRRSCWKALYDDFATQIRIKYPQIKATELKTLARDKTERLIKKYSY